MNILITGASGFIGRNLSRLLSRSKHHTIDTATRSQLDLLDYDAVRKFFNGKHYDLVIHTAIEGGRRTMPDDKSIVYHNILMTYDLLENQDNFDRMIILGSGAELDRRYDINNETNPNKRYPVDCYGLSKSVINRVCQTEPKLYNFRIFNCFGPDEHPERMIRGNIEKYIRNEPMTLFSNRLMDFFYIDDLALLIEYFLETPEFPHKTIDCSYGSRVYLRDILDTINALDDYSVPIIEIPDESLNDMSISFTDYIGTPPDLPLNFVGLKDGIQITYKQIKETYETNYVLHTNGE